MEKEKQIVASPSGHHIVGALRLWLDLIGEKNAKKRIAFALRRGYRFTSHDLNKIGRTVDARKYISRLRNKDKVDIADIETTRDEKNFKEYFLLKQ